VRVLLDEMLPAGVVVLIPGHDVLTTSQAGFKGFTNGELIRRAVADGCDVLTTADRNLPAQQNIQASGIAVILVRGSRIVDVARQAAGIQAAVAAARPGTVTRVEPR
jgi:hypothetical protein